MIKVIYIGGFRGVGKTRLVRALRPCLSVALGESQSSLHPRLDFEWSSTDIFPGDPIWPSQPTDTEEFRFHLKEPLSSARDLLSIPKDARIGWLVGDNFIFQSKPEERTVLLRAMVSRMLCEVDIVVTDMYPRAPYELGDVFVEVVTSLEELECRSKLPSYGLRAPFNKNEAIKFIQIGCGRITERLMGRPWKVVWSEDDVWVPIEQGVKKRIDSLEPWYQAIPLTGIWTTDPRGENGLPKWEAICRVLPDDITGWRIADIGMNAGCLSAKFVEKGASEVVGWEYEERFLRQFSLVCEMGPWSAEITSRIKTLPFIVHTAPIQDHGPFDLAVLSSVHYHINRSCAPYRSPVTKRLIPGLLPPLEVLLEDIKDCCNKVLFIWGLGNISGPNPLEEAHPEWVVNVLNNFNFRSVDVFSYGGLAIVWADCK